MAKLLTQKGLSNNGAPINIGSPPKGMKWIIKYVFGVMHTGSTTGTRNLTIWINRATNYTGNNTPGPILVQTDQQTGTDTTYYANGDITNTIGFYSNENSWYTYPEIFDTDTIQAGLSNFISGDTFDYYIMVEEVVA